MHIPSIRLQYVCPRQVLRPEPGKGLDGRSSNLETGNPIGGPMAASGLGLVGKDPSTQMGVPEGSGLRVGGLYETFLGHDVVD
jgi:hypothetical protein